MYLGYKHDHEDDGGGGDHPEAEAGGLDAGRQDQPRQRPRQPQRQHESQRRADVRRLAVVLTDAAALRAE